MTKNQIKYIHLLTKIVNENGTYIVRRNDLPIKDFFFPKTLKYPKTLDQSPFNIYDSNDGIKMVRIIPTHEVEEYCEKYLSDFMQKVYDTELERFTNKLPAKNIATTLIEHFSEIVDTFMETISKKINYNVAQDLAWVLVVHKRVFSEYDFIKIGHVRNFILFKASVKNNHHAIHQ